MTTGIEDVQARLRQLANDLWVLGPEKAFRAGDPELLLRVAHMLSDWGLTQLSLDCVRRERDEAMGAMRDLRNAEATR